jgi:dipeptidyl aminopeptidase/acylaminoacyl peptidase
MSVSVQRLLELGRVSTVVPSPCGTFLVAAVARVDAETARFVSKLVRVPLDGRAPTDLTRGKTNDRAPTFRQDGSLGFLSNREGDRDQVWLLPASGEPYALTDEPLGVTAFAFAEASPRFVVLADVLPGVAHDQQREAAKDLATKGPSDLHYTSHPVRHWDHWLGRAAPHFVVYDGPARVDLTPDANAEHRGDPAFAIAPNGTRAAIVERLPSPDRMQDGALRVFELDARTSRLLGKLERRSFERPLFSPSGRVLVARRTERSKEHHGKTELVQLDAESGQVREVLSSWDRWPVPHGFVDEQRLLVTADDEGAHPVYVVDLADGGLERISSRAAGGSHDSVAWNGAKVTGVRHTFLHPPEPFAMKLAPESEPALVARLSGFADGEARMRLERMKVPSTDGVPIDVFVARPPDTTRAPMLLWIHGGPVSAFADAWHWRWNPLPFTNAGYAVVLPNPRGSTGYGQAFIEGIWKNSWGAQCYEDVLAVADAVAARPDVDGTRTAAMGGSFGGYMVNWIGGHTDRFGALVSHAGIFDHDSLGGVSDYGVWFSDSFGVTVDEDREAFERFSPHRFVTKWKTPTLVLHGERDFRVPIGEALTLFEALQRNRVPSELVVFPDENHWILKPRNVVAWYEHVLRFLDAHVR